MKLFKNDLEPSCAYCSYGSVISDTEVMCIKKGVVEIYGSCRRFKYDPLKRIPDEPAAIISSSLLVEESEENDA